MAASARTATSQCRISARTVGSCNSCAWRRLRSASAFSGWLVPHSPACPRVEPELPWARISAGTTSRGSPLASIRTNRHQLAYGRLTQMRFSRPLSNGHPCLCALHATQGLSVKQAGWCGAHCGNTCSARRSAGRVLSTLTSPVHWNQIVNTSSKSLHVTWHFYRFFRDDDEPPRADDRPSLVSSRLELGRALRFPERLPLLLPAPDPAPPPLPSLPLEAERRAALDLDLNTLTRGSKSAPSKLVYSLFRSGRMGPLFHIKSKPPMRRSRPVVLHTTSRGQNTANVEHYHVAAAQRTAVPGR